MEPPEIKDGGIGVEQHQEDQEPDPGQEDFSALVQRLAQGDQADHHEEPEEGMKLDMGVDQELQPEVQEVQEQDQDTQVELNPKEGLLRYGFTLLDGGSGVGATQTQSNRDTKRRRKRGKQEQGRNGDLLCFGVEILSGVGVMSDQGAPSSATLDDNVETLDQNPRNVNVINVGIGMPRYSVNGATGTPNPDDNRRVAKGRRLLSN